MKIINSNYVLQKEGIDAIQGIEQNTFKKTKRIIYSTWKKKEEKYFCAYKLRTHNELLRLHFILPSFLRRLKLLQNSVGKKELNSKQNWLGHWHFFPVYPFPMCYKVRRKYLLGIFCLGIDGVITYISGYWKNHMYLLLLGRVKEGKNNNFFMNINFKIPITYTFMPRKVLNCYRNWWDMSNNFMISVHLNKILVD